MDSLCNSMDAALRVHAVRWSLPLRMGAWLEALVASFSCKQSPSCVLGSVNVYILPSFLSLLFIVPFCRRRNHKATVDSVLTWSCDLWGIPEWQHLPPRWLLSILMFSYGALVEIAEGTMCKRACTLLLESGVMAPHCCLRLILNIQSPCLPPLALGFSLLAPRCMWTESAVLVQMTAWWELSWTGALALRNALFRDLEQITQPLSTTRSCLWDGIGVGLEMTPWFWTSVLGYQLLWSEAWCWGASRAQCSAGESF